MGESRLFKILYYLLERDKVTAGELAEKLEVSVRTVYRDIDALGGAGIPVYTEPGRRGGIRLLDGFVLDRVLLSEEEKQETLAALKSLGGTRGLGEGAALEKLSALFHVRSESWLEVDFSGWGGAEGDNRKFEQLKSAVIQQKSVRITYAGANEAVCSRVVHPVKLCYKSRAWYLKAFCTKRQGYRTFKLSRILELEPLKEGFSPHLLPQREEKPQREYRTVTLRFPEELAYRVYDEFAAEQVRRRDGALIVSAPLPVDSWLVGYLLSFGGRAEVLEPAELRAALREQAKQIYETYKP